MEHELRQRPGVGLEPGVAHPRVEFGADVGRAPERRNTEVKRASSAASAGCWAAEAAVTEAACSQNAMIPPGRTRSANEHSAWVGSCMNIKTNRPTAASNSRPGSRCRASAWRNETLAIACAARRCSATTMASSSTSTPVTEPSGPTRALTRKLTSPTRCQERACPRRSQRGAASARSAARRSQPARSAAHIRHGRGQRHSRRLPRSLVPLRVSRDRRITGLRGYVPLQGLAGDRDAELQHKPDPAGVGEQLWFPQRVPVGDQQVG